MSNAKIYVSFKALIYKFNRKTAAGKMRFFNSFAIERKYFSRYYNRQNYA